MELIDPQTVRRLEAIASVIAKAAEINARVAGMQAENQSRSHRGVGVAYDDTAFRFAEIEMAEHRRLVCI